MSSLIRENYRGRPIPTGVGGLVGVAALLGAVAAVRLRTPYIALFLAHATALTKQALLVASAAIPAGILALGAAVVGLIDDFSLDKGTKGLKGHVAALKDYRVTSGLIKAVYGALAGVAAAFTLFTFGSETAPYLGDRSLLMLVVDALVVALSMNAFNLLDLRPGRALKVWLPLAALVWAGAWFGAPAAVRTAYLQPQLVAGFAVALVLFPFDLRERLMLGDAGTMALGALVGFSIIATMGPWVRVAAVVVLVSLHMATERISLSSVIDRTPFLAWLDRLGRPG